ncbi:MAG: tRNA 2-thiouridine(34) synthase MnmA [Patescibacteria group bacterium]|nr:tRNA 2-thiouridine(34) synthase MnmA [Patescibacteria group bacterium]MDE2438297.1 tRNA 2-thiouridine(34) synthase MnmA [Patescibacteria group bacterium]
MNYAKSTQKPLVIVAMSGGVDSSVAAALFTRATTPHEFKALTGRTAPKGFSGFQVVGVYMKCWSENNPCALNDEADAHRVAAQLKIPFYTFDFEKEYAKNVVDYMVRGYSEGITPNPDVMCNKVIKFGIFLRTARAWRADYIATGHYVRLREGKTQNAKIKSYELAIARDLNKDQSYFLWTLTQRQLQYCLFPLGNYTKPEVRALATQFGLSTADKKDSQGICFLGDVRLDEFLEKRLLHTAKPGPTMSLDGAVLGTHKGAALYTIGQRHGLGLQGGDGIYCVVKKDVQKNIVYVARKDNRDQFGQELAAKHLQWIEGVVPMMPLRVTCRTRYRQALVRATLTQQGVRTVRVIFDRPHRAITPGQSIVFYKGNTMLGGGIIA